MVNPYLNKEKSVKRLVDEYKEHGRLIVAYDFDNTVYDYHDDGHDYQFTIDLLRKAKHDFGCHLIVFTSCEDDQFDWIRSWLKENNIPFDGINETPDFVPFDGKKIYYNILLDDRAGLRASIEDLSMTFKILEDDYNG